jgi:hypothetical protein
MQLLRPRPHRFVDDLTIGRTWTDASVVVIGAAAELAGGAPAYVWRTGDAARAQAGDHRDRALGAWRRLRETAEPSNAQQFRLLGSVHRAAPTVVCAIANGIGPYELPLNPKSVNDALTRMRARSGLLTRKATMGGQRSPPRRLGARPCTRVGSPTSAALRAAHCE